MKKLLKAGLALMMACSLAACGDDSGGTSTEGNKGGTYIVAVSGEPNTLNPDTYSDDYNYDMAQNIFNRIVKLNNNYEVLPDLAETWEVSEDALTYTFHLVDNATWHDGEPVTAADAKYTYDTIVAENYANANVFAYVDEIVAEDDTTLVFKMSQPDASFLSNLAWYGTFVLPQHILEGQDWTTSDFNENPIGSGPFKFSEWNKGTDVRLVRNDDYWGDVAYLDQVIYTIIPDTNTQYQAWLNNEVDEIASTSIPVSEIESLQANGDYTWVTQVWPSPYYITFNLNDGPFADANVRMAVAMGVNREEVSEKAFAGYKPANDYYIPDIYTDALNEDAKQPDYDSDGAMALLEEAGYTKDADGYYFETEVTVFEGFEDAATVVIAELDKIGIKATLSVLDYNIWTEQVWNNQQFEITMVSGFQGPDVLGTGRRWTADGTVNVNFYSDPEIEELYAQALSSSDQDEINDLMKQIQVILARDNPLVTMVNYADVAAYKSYVHGHPMFTDEQGGSRDKAGFSELTYVWLDEIE